MALVHQASILNGIQKLYRFQNNYGASVICHPYSLGGLDGLYEIAVIVFHSDDNFDFMITYDTPITGDVIGYVPFDGIDIYLKQIEKLPLLR